VASQVERAQAPVWRTGEIPLVTSDEPSSDNHGGHARDRRDVQERPRQVAAISGHRHGRPWTCRACDLQDMRQADSEGWASLSRARGWRTPRLSDTHTGAIR